MKSNKKRKEDEIVILRRKKKRRRMIRKIVERLILPANIIMFVILIILIVKSVDNCMIIEVGFMSSCHDNLWFRKYNDDIAEAIARGIADHCQYS